MKKSIDHKRLAVNITTTPALKRMACLISEKAGTCIRNSIKTGKGNSVSHGYNAAILIAAKYFKFADLTKIDDFYNNYNSKS
jgi:hypothetical protein